MDSNRQVQLLSSGTQVTSLAFSPETALLLAGNTRGHLNFYRVRPVLSHWVSFVSHSTFFDRDSAGAESEHVAAAEIVAELRNAVMCVSANEKTIKLWSVGQRDSKPHLRLTFPPVHDFRVHSLSVHPARDQFIACDDLTLTLWHFDHPATAFSLADLRPRHIEELREVLLFATFHPIQTSLLVYSSTAGTIRIADLRLRAQALPPALELRNRRPRAHLDLLNSVSGIAFGASEHLLFARDIRSVSTWDLRHSGEPLETTVVITNERRLHARGDTPKFQITALGASGWVTGGMDGNLLIAHEQGPKIQLDLGLGEVFVPFVASDRQHSRVFVGTMGQVMALSDDIRIPLSP